MNKQFLVQEFMLATGRQAVPLEPTIPDEASSDLRIRLINEEAHEFAVATHEGDMIAVADALADLLYVVYGAAVAWGIEINPVFLEVHRANMQKFAPGSYEREDGKWMKPPDWQPPDIESVLEAQGWKRSESHG